VLFFTGKGGVGKTSVACSVAVTLADQGHRVLLVSTDPASNLAQVLGSDVGESPTRVDGVTGLDAMDIDPEAAAAAYRESMVAPYRGVLPDAAIASMEEQLSGACTVEIAAFNEFAHLVGNPEATADYDHVIFDTAPTGHTLRLLTLPSAWTEFIETNTTGNSCLGPLSGLTDQQALYARTVESLADPARTTLVLVSRPDDAALREAARSSAELGELGIRNQRLVLNGLFSATVVGDPVADALEERGARALAATPVELAGLPDVRLPFTARPPVGIEGLRALASPGTDAGESAAHEPEASGRTVEGAITLDDLVTELEAGGPCVVMAMGKGGVGKTTVAAAIALALARRGQRVHLSTTDPAAHVAGALGDVDADLTVSRIDPAAEVAAYRELVLAQTAPDLDPSALAMLEEDLRSPCTEEIAIFRAFARVVAEATEHFVILDTAPTGHTLLLLDSSESFHREVSRTASDTPPEVLELLPRLRNPHYTKVLVVTLAEATPVTEAARLQDDLARAGIAPFAWVVNQSFITVRTSDPLLARRGASELPYLEEIRAIHASRMAFVPWSTRIPVGEGLLGLLTATQGEIDG